MAGISEARKRKLFRDLDKRDESFVRKIEPFLDGLYKYYFRTEFDGFENVPDQQALYVGNHNGMITWEVVMMFYAWYQRYGFTRRALGLAHAVAVDNPLFRWFCPKIGAIPAHPEIAIEAMNRGYSLLVYPGGEKESFRPIYKRKEVNFFQRKGFIRLALKAGVPIVPVASIGAHETYFVVHQGEEIAKKLGLYDKMRLHGFPLTPQSIFFFWCMATGMFTFFPLLAAPAAFASIFVPLPSKMKFKILEPIDVSSMMDSRLTEEENHQRIYDHIVGTLQHTVADEYDKRQIPILG